MRQMNGVVRCTKQIVSQDETRTDELRLECTDEDEDEGGGVLALQWKHLKVGAACHAAE